MTYMVEGTQYQTYNCFVLKEPDTEKDKGTKLTAPPSIVKPAETDPAPADSYETNELAEIGKYSSTNTLIKESGWNFSLFAEQQKRESIRPYESFQSEGASVGFGSSDRDKVSFEAGVQHFVGAGNSINTVPFVGVTFRLK